MLSESAKDWLKGRGVSPDTAMTVGVSSLQRNGGEWLVFPMKREGKLVSRRYRNITEKQFRQDADAPFKLVWNEDALREPEYSGTIIITEGEIDALAALEAGYERVVSVPDGAPAQEIGDQESAKYGYLDGLMPLLKGEREIIIAADGDQAGANLLADLASRLGKGRCKYLRYPPGCKDLGDVIQKFGEAGVTKVIDRARHVKVSGLTKITDMPPAEDLKVHKVGICKDFDDHVSILRKQLSIHTGVPGHGKSTGLRAICIEMAQRYGWRICVATFEDDVQLDYRQAVACYLNKVGPEALTPPHLDRADAFLDKHFSFIVPEDDYDDEVTVDWLLERGAAAVTRYGADMLVIDPWTELDHERGDLHENEYTSVMLKRLKRWARTFNAHVAVVAHPRKMEERKDGGFKPPNGYSISGSSMFYNKADLGLTWYKDPDQDENVATLICWKVKRHAAMQAKPGRAHLAFNAETGRYWDLYDVRAAA